MKLINPSIINDELKSVFMPLMFWGLIFLSIDIRYRFDVTKYTHIPRFISIFISDSMDANVKLREMSMLGIFCILLMVVKLRSLSIRASSDVARIMYWVGMCFVTFAFFFKKVVDDEHHGSACKMIGVGLGLVVEGVAIVWLVDYMGRTRSKWHLRRNLLVVVVRVLQFFRIFLTFMLAFLRSFIGPLFSYLKKR